MYIQIYALYFFSDLSYFMHIFLRPKFRLIFLFIDNSQ